MCLYNYVNKTIMEAIIFIILQSHRTTYSNLAGNNTIPPCALKQMNCELSGMYFITVVWVHP